MGKAAVVTGMKDYAHITLWALLGILVGRMVDVVLGLIKDHLELEHEVLASGDSKVVECLHTVAAIGCCSFIITPDPLTTIC